MSVASLSAPSPAPCRRARVLVADNDDTLRTLLCTVLADDGFDVIEAQNGYEIVERLHDSADRRTMPVDLIISDIWMPWASGLQILDAIRSAGWRVPVILMTAFGTSDTVAEAARLGADEVFDKPFRIDDLRAAARRLTASVAPRPPGIGDTGA